MNRIAMQQSSSASLERIVDAAMSLAAEHGWEAVRLAEVASRAGITLGELQRHVPEKHALIDAWLDRADRTMLACVEQPDYASWPTAQRVRSLIASWLLALDPHRHTTAQMLLATLAPGHLHWQATAAMRLSRTVQWVREAAGCQAEHLYREIEETAMTAMFVAVVGCWLVNANDGYARALRLLDRMLAMQAGMARSLPEALRWTPDA